MTGSRRSDTPRGDIPDDLQPGDYWKVIHRRTGKPLHSDEPTNLTGTVWMVVAPSGEWHMGQLTKHTVREHEDGTISVRPGDGSSNSILITDGQQEHWHGYIEHGEWRPV
jgi:hypothetical protein